MQTEFARKIVVVGGSAGGAGVAARLRRLNENFEILLIEKSRAISFATCGIPYFIGNVIKDSERMRAHSAEEFSQLLSIDVRVRHELVAINRRAQCVDIRDLKNGKIYQEAYDKLVLALGSKPRMFDAKKRAKNVFSIRGFEETAVIKHYIHANSCRRAVVVGAGYVGVEMAENLARIGLQVCLIDSSNQVLHHLDPEISSVAQRHLKEKKITVVLNESVDKTVEDGVLLKSGRKINSDITILAMGVKPNSKLAEDCGLKLGDHGGVLVNAGLYTSDPNIFALGDVAELKDRHGKSSITFAFAGPAQKQARIVAENIVGKHSQYKPGPTSSILKVFNLSIASAGSNETRLRASKIHYLKSYTESPSNASFYPGAQSMVIKLLFSPLDGKVLGAQIIGAAGVDKRIDVLATVIRANMTVEDLAELDLSYAPPYSSAKDPVNVAGMVACNMLFDEDYEVLHWQQVDEAIEHGFQVLDVRTEEEFELRNLPNAVNIPLEQLRDRLDELDKNRPILIYCGYGKKGYFALKSLKNSGFSNVYNLSGGLTVYSMARIQNSTGTKSTAESLPFGVKAGNKDVVAKHVDLSTNRRKNESGLAMVTPTLKDEIELIDIENLSSNDSSLYKTSTELHETDNGDWPQPESSGVDQDADLVEELNFDELILQENILLRDHNEILSDVAYIEVDATGLSCPGPIMKLAKTMRDANLGDIVQITATDSGFAHDIHNWCQKKGHRLLEFDDSSSTIRAVLLKS